MVQATAILASSIGHKSLYLPSHQLNHLILQKKRIIDIVLSEEANQLVNNNQINMQTYFIQLAWRWFTIQQFYGGSMKVLSVG